MSWDVYLSGEGVEVDHHEEGGTYALGGTSEPWLNVTYNYGERFREAASAVEWPGQPSGLREMLHQKRAAEVALLLAKAASWLTEQSAKGEPEDPHGRPADDYWRPTYANASLPLITLSRWAHRNPDAKFEV